MSSPKIDIVGNETTFAVYKDNVLVGTADDASEILELLSLDISWHDMWDVDTNDFPLNFSELSSEA